jgi:hypothetical protein
VVELIDELDEKLVEWNHSEYVQDLLCRVSYNSEKTSFLLWRYLHEVQVRIEPCMCIQFLIINYELSGSSAHWYSFLRNAILRIHTRLKCVFVAIPIDLLFTKYFVLVVSKNLLSSSIDFRCSIFLQSHHQSVNGRERTRYMARRHPAQSRRLCRPNCKTLFQSCIQSSRRGKCRRFDLDLVGLAAVQG